VLGAPFPKSISEAAAARDARRPVTSAGSTGALGSAVAADPASAAEGANSPDVAGAG
jgi:hypothetical protein